MSERTWIVLRREPAPTPITARVGTTGLLPALKAASAGTGLKDLPNRTGTPDGNDKDAAYLGYWAGGSVVCVTNCSRVVGAEFLSCAKPVAWF